MLRQPHVKPIYQCALLIALCVILMSPTSSRAEDPPLILDNPRSGVSTCSHSLRNGDIFVQRFRVNQPAHLDNLSIWYFAGEDTITPTISVLVLDLFMRPMGAAVTTTIEPSTLEPVMVTPTVDLGPGVFIISSTLIAPGWNGAGLIVDCQARYPEPAEQIYVSGGSGPSRPMFFRTVARPWPEYVPPKLTFLPVTAR